MQRVQPKQCRHQRAAPERTGQTTKQQKDQHRVERMQQHAGQVMSPGLQAEELAVRHVGPHR